MTEATRTGPELPIILCPSPFSNSYWLEHGRIFFQYKVPSETTRGEHAHRKCHQALICVHGRMTVTTRNSQETRRFDLTEATQMLYLPPMVWAEQSGFSPDAACLVLASDPYEAGDYIRDIETWETEFRQIKD